MSEKTKEKKDVTLWLAQQSKEIVDQYLPPSYAEREFLAGLRLVLQSNRDVWQATQTDAGRANFACELRKAASWGISINPADGLVSFFTVENRIIAHLDAKGLVEKVIRDEAARECRTHTVYENDQIEIEETEQGDRYRFRPAIKDRGPVSGFLAMAKLHDGSTRALYLTAEQISEWATRFSRKKDGDLKPLPRYNFEAYGQKTALRQLLTKIRIAGYGEQIEEPPVIEGVTTEPPDPKAPANSDDVRAALETSPKKDWVDEDGDHRDDADAEGSQGDLYGTYDR